MLRSLRILAVLLLAASMAASQVTTRPPGASGGGGTFTGGTITTPILGPAADNCTTPPFSFTGNTSSGLCSSASGVTTLKSAGAMELYSTGTTYLLYWDLGNLFPATGDARDLGKSTNPWKSVYVTRSIQGSKSKTLTDASATAFVRIAISQSIGSNYEAGRVGYTIYCDDATNQAVQRGTVDYACHNLAGTESCGFGTPSGVTLGDGTASLSTPAFTAVSNAVDTIDLLVNSDCTGVTPSTLHIEWRLDMEAPATITPL